MSRLLLLAPLALLAGCPGNADGWGGMRRQPKALAYRETPVFEDERVMRQPPPGTVPRSRRGKSLLFMTGKEAPDGGFAGEIPLTLTREVFERGQHAYEIYCATCHGILGDGVSQVGRNMALRPPPSLLDLSPQPEGYYYAVISEGFGLMPGYAEKLSPEERWAVVAYVRALQSSQRARLEDVPPEARPLLLKEGAP